ncbi:uncharacterized protein LOC129591088 [Paramacrobiotus metropolitanus]|uniref:uncharacterized protein LOC129591088 n=1 Tax=Paramacrobiotus metropolitanus TaxID=2943436 RepID=UPI002445E700|nr:uncharacterized protein LOC129591088 [Paramacrobiotus metropolitanus]
MFILFPRPLNTHYPTLYLVHSGSEWLEIHCDKSYSSHLSSEILLDSLGIKLGFVGKSVTSLTQPYRPEYSLQSESGRYDPFVVDVLGAAGEYMRGYVCNVDEQGLTVKLDDLTVQHVAYGRVWSVKEPDFGESTMKRNSGDIDVRIDPTDSGVTSWTPARLVDSIHWSREWYHDYHRRSCRYSVVTVEVSQPDTTVAQYTVIDGPTALTQRVRKRGDLGPVVQRNAFQKVLEPMFNPSEKYPHPVRFLKTACSFPRFHTFWLRDTHTILLGLHDEYMELLLSPVRAKLYNMLKEDYIAGNGRNDDCAPVRKSIADCVEGLFIMQRWTVDEILGGLVCTVLQSEEFRDGEPCFSELILEIQTLIYSNLDIFHQNLFKRVCKATQHLLDSRIIQSCVIMPTRPLSEALHPDAKTSTYSTWMWKGSFAYTHYLARTVTSHCRTLCLVGEREYCLSFLVDLLNFLSLKLKWLVVTDNAQLYIHELFDFPQPTNVLTLTKADVYMLFPYKSPEFRTICDNILLRNCVFDAKESINFPIICDNGSMMDIDNELFIRYEDTFLISVAHWSFSFAGTTKADYLASVRRIFEVGCPELQTTKVYRLLDGLNAYPVPKHLPEDLL